MPSKRAGPNVFGLILDKGADVVAGKGQGLRAKAASTGVVNAGRLARDPDAAAGIGQQGADVIRGKARMIFPRLIAAVRERVEPEIARADPENAVAASLHTGGAK